MKANRTAILAHSLGGVMTQIHFAASASDAPDSSNASGQGGSHNSAATVDAVLFYGASLLRKCTAPPARSPRPAARATCALMAPAVRRSLPGVLPWRRANRSLRPADDHGG